jgi:hypothetical protein
MHMRVTLNSIAHMSISADQREDSDIIITDTVSDDLWVVPRCAKAKLLRRIVRVYLLHARQTVADLRFHTPDDG